MPEPSRRCLLLLAIIASGCTMQSGGASATPAPTATPVTTVAATPSASPTPTPGPTPAPDPGSLALEATSCEGGVVLSWSASTNPDFHHYTALRSPDRDVAPDWPPIAPAVDWGQTYATDPFVTSAVDASILPSDTRWNYRVMAYDEEGRVVAASPVRPAQIHPLADLGSLRVDARPDGFTRLRWHPYDGFSECFSQYRVMYGIGSTPATVLTVISDQSAGELPTDALHAGTTYELRVQAMRSTPLGSFVVGQTETTTYTVP
ncbi:MAG TPA: hypothetical protein VFU44_03900 [Candidatus Limnocylindria bacterium]|nr:hypothetical protein [Candidatus Limnocylindria bacterium]